MHNLLAHSRRLFLFSAAGFFTLGASSALLYEAAHQYVEHVQLAQHLDQDVRKWEWHRSAEYWADPLRSGTDPALGFRGRHILRAAWMASNWGIGYHPVDAALHKSDDFLRSAIRIAEERAGPATLNALLLRHASVLELLGGNFRAASKTEYERAWAISPEAHVAWKLGQLNSQLGHPDDALAWWMRSILLASGKNSDGDARAVPSSAPSSPYAQRTLTNTLVSLSAFYAASGQLTEAQRVQESTLNLIRSIPSPESPSSPAQLLHTLYLLHRSSLLSIHLAEVLHAQKQPSFTSIQWLTSAAESSERVAYALTGLPIDGFHRCNPVPQAQGKELINTYKSSHTMNKMASNLLRDASRTAAEAWHLIGILHESARGPSSDKALKCYERAVEWAGKTTPQSDKVAADGTLEADWKTIWSNYHRLKQHASQDK
ncbi:hypothetical protein APHAL10511_001180 [Amanita phalloides]|nr:hypothetical protein APHAL10511_001180 [Amanita phalloides]